MADPRTRTRYDLTESERRQRLEMAQFSAALLHRLTSHHPRIVAALQRKQQAKQLKDQHP